MKVGGQKEKEPEGEKEFGGFLIENRGSDSSDLLHELETGIPTENCKETEEEAVVRSTNASDDE